MLILGILLHMEMAMLVVQVLTAVAAVAAVILSPLIARQQIAASTISINRQNWINAVRSDLAALISKLRSLPSTEENPKNEARLRAALARVLHLKTRIEMSLNPTEAEHNKLIDLMNKATERAKDEAREGPSEILDEDDNKLDDLDDILQKIIQTAQVIFKAEWNRVKAGK